MYCFELTTVLQLQALHLTPTPCTALQYPSPTPGSAVHVVEQCTPCRPHALQLQLHCTALHCTALLHPTTQYRQKHLYRVGAFPGRRCRYFLQAGECRASTSAQWGVPMMSKRACSSVCAVLFSWAMPNTSLHAHTHLPCMPCADDSQCVCGELCM